MNITISKQKEHVDGILVWWTLTDDALNEYQWHGDIPKDVDVQGFIEGQMQTYLKLIRRRGYPDMPFLRPEQGQTDLQAIEQWIADGCIIPAVLDEEGNEIEPERVAEKVEWTNKHPVESEYFDRKKISIESKQILKDAVTVEDIKEYLKKVHKYHETTIRNNI